MVIIPIAQENATSNVEAGFVPKIAKPSGKGGFCPEIVCETQSLSAKLASTKDVLYFYGKKVFIRNLKI